MMSINKRRRDLNECLSDHLSPRMFESPKARSDDQILRRRHSSTEADRRRSIEFERQDFDEEIRHWSNLRQQSREQTRQDGVTVQFPTPVKNNIDGQPSASQKIVLMMKLVMTNLNLPIKTYDRLQEVRVCYNYRNYFSLRIEPDTC